MLSRAASIAANMARWVAGPSTRIRASFRSDSGGGGLARAGESAGVDAQATATASSAPATTRITRLAPVPGLAAARGGLDADVVLDRAHAVHLLGGVRRAACLVVAVGEARKLHDAAIGLDIDIGRGLYADVGCNGGLHLRRHRSVVDVLAGRLLLAACLLV